MAKANKLVNLFNSQFVTGSKADSVKVIYTYRYASLLLTSLFYIVGEPRSPILLKLGVIASLCLCSKLILDLYIKLQQSNTKLLKGLVLVETFGIILLLFPTGGLESPFIWYALNPVLVAASYLEPVFCWFNMASYLACATLMSICFLNINGKPAVEFLKGKSHAILVFILITLAVQLLSSLTRKLYYQSEQMKRQRVELLEVNQELEDSNKRFEESIEHIMSLYQIVEAFTRQQYIGDLFQAFVEYTAELTNAKFSFFIGDSASKYKRIFAVNSGESTGCIIDTIDQKLKGSITDFSAGGRTIELNIDEKRYVIAGVRSNLRNYGFIGILLNDSSLKLCQFYEKQLSFISNICAIVLERFDLEEMEEQLVLLDEQNRIANEIHDNVSQRLFGITYAMYSIDKKWEFIDSKILKTQMESIRKSANLALQELRASIYRLSSRKRGDTCLYSSVKSYLDSVSELNDVAIDLTISGDEELLCSSIKKAIIRIIREAAGNSVRHGKSKSFKVKIQVELDVLRMDISDDGQGFLMSTLTTSKKTGLGIGNMKHIVDSLQGSFEIDSRIGEGVDIVIIIPNKRLDLVREGGVAI